MKNTIKFLFFAVTLMLSANTMAQSIVTGTVLDPETNEPLPGVNVIEVGTTNGVSTNFDGIFSLKSTSVDGKVAISYVGYEKKTVSFNGNTSLGNIMLLSNNTLEEVVITGSGIIDLAEDRNTPVAVSTIKASEIREKAGNWDLPEVLKSTPSVQNIKGGGFGEGSMFLRGFDQTNTAFLLNGQPINGMEDGKMYWSNWSGVLDVANAVQVQRGLGSSKLAISSVGGTVNIVTKTIDRREGGFVQQMVGNNDFTKTTAYYSTGVNEKGWSFASLLGHWQGDGYVDYTAGQGQTYFFSVGYQPNENHTLNFLITGAPQWHAAAGRGSIGTFLENGRRYNDWNEAGVNSPNLIGGRYPGGRNIYHKPVSNLTWDWTINDKSELSTVLYGSLGRGAFASLITDRNTGEALYARGSNNNHNWFGLVTNYSNKLSETLSLNVGADVRTYNGIHFRGVTEFLGQDSVNTGSTFLGDYTINEAYGINPWEMVFNTNTTAADRMSYNYEEVITYYGLFGQLEYSKDAISAFFQGAISNQDHLVTNEFNYEDSRESEKVSNLGYNLKAGAAYAINDSNKVFVNAGYYSRQPFHDNLLDNNRNSVDLIKPAVENEKITGLEAGYQFGGEMISANLNVYHTIWDNRTVPNSNGENQESATYEAYQNQGQKQVHSGVELEVFTRPMENLRVNGFLSLGDWKYKGEVTRRTFNADGVEIGEQEKIDIDGLNVGGAAKVTGGVNANYEILPRFSVDGAWNWYNDQHSEGPYGQDTPPLSLPSYQTVDAGVSFKALVGKEKQNSIQFRVNINNVFDEVYLESVFGTEAASSDPSQNYKGINKDNNGRFGYGRTWNTSVRFNF
ncbi:carboxypeptidase-like regulatory domain-containing protein [Bizionia paragorgiae]|jgi:iron complex outermembrane recepter protein|uniref:TonB-dependent receptor n=1 Tax=Bizionia paragorgiae TaxID=283786 RepID=UPI003A90FE27